MAARAIRLPGANPKVTQVYRAHLSFHSGADVPARTVIVKIPAEDPDHRGRHAAGRVYEREIAVYKLLRTAHGSSLAWLYAAAYDESSGMGAMVIEDLGAADPSGGLVPPGSAGEVVNYLALLHAAFWESSELAAAGWLRGTKHLDLWGDPPGLYPPGWRRVSKRRDVGDRLHRIGDALVTRLPAVLAELERRPRTLVHADLCTPATLCGGMNRTCRLSLTGRVRPSQAARATSRSSSFTCVLKSLPCMRSVSWSGITG